MRFYSVKNANMQLIWSSVNSISLNKINNSNLKKELQTKTVGHMIYEFILTRVNKKWRKIVDGQSAVGN